MCTYYKPIDQFKNCGYYLPQRIGPGALQNEQIRKCYICADNGFQKEAIAFKKLSNGKWLLLDYFTGQPHKHRCQEVEYE